MHMQPGRAGVLGDDRDLFELHEFLGDIVDLHRLHFDVHEDTRELLIGLCVDDRREAADNAAVLHILDALAHGRARQIHLIRQIRERDPSVLLEDVQYPVICFVKYRHICLSLHFLFPTPGG